MPVNQNLMKIYLLHSAETIYNTIIVEIFKILYTAFGGLGLFFFGMKSMSEGLQALGSNTIKKVIGSLTSNRVFAVLVGIVVTAIVQSSSVSTVMTLGFVNAGLMSLTQAVGIIFGANIGTTVTGWIISIKVGKYGLLLIALSVYPALYAKAPKWRYIGKAIMGIGMIFFGLELMSGAFKPLRTYPGFIDALHYFAGEGYVSILLSVLMGCLLTVIVQSSSAMLGITIALAVSGVIQYHTAAALVLGENIGTTITALLASVGGNINTKRAARAHACFNLFGVLVVLSFFPYFVAFVEWVIPGAANLVNADGERPYIAYHIATGHSIFNITATLLFLPFLNKFTQIIVRLTPDTSEGSENHLTILGNSRNIVPATAIVQAQEELEKMKRVVDKMVNVTRSALENPNKDSSASEEIKHCEQLTDNMQREITVFLLQVMEKRLSTEQTAEIRRIIRIADELESVADYLDKIISNSDRFKDESTLSEEIKNEYFGIYDEVSRYYYNVAASIEGEVKIDGVISAKTSDEVKSHIDEIREQNVARAANGAVAAESSLFYSDMVVSLRKIRAHVLNISQALG